MQTATLTYQDEKFVWRGGYDTRMLPKRAGFRWNPKGKVWWSDDVTKAALLKDYADESVAPKLEGVFDTIEASRSHEAPVDFDPMVPEGLELYPYQSSGVRWLVDHPNTLLADEMGLGKTIQVAVALNHIDREGLPVLIICPASLKANWAAELKTWLTWDARIQILHGSKDAVDAQADIVIVNYDICHRAATGKSLRAVDRWSLVVCDECHYLKNPKTLRTKAVLGTPAKRKNRKVVEEAIDGFCDKARSNFMLTGTPIPNRTVELQGIAGKLDPVHFGHFFRFALRYCAAHDNGYGWDFSGSSNLDELQAKLRSTIMLRRLKADVLTELPAKMRGVVVMEPDAACAEVLQREMDYDPEELGKMLAAGDMPSFDEMSSVRADLALAKAPLVADYVKEQLEAGLKKVVVFAHHTTMIDRLERDLSEFGTVSITGKTPVADRQGIVKRFQEDPSIQVFIGNIIAAGVGITLTASNRVIMAELDWVPGNVTQAEDRCHRIGQADTVQVTHLVVDGSLDAHLVKTLIAKQRVMDSALDDDSDVFDAFNRQTAQEVAKQTKQSEPGEAKGDDQISRYRASSRAEKVKQAESKWGVLNEDREDAIREALIRMSACDEDHGREQNMIGWNGQHTQIGHSLSETAETGSLSPLQYYTGLKILNTYKNTQLADLAERLYPE